MRRPVRHMSAIALALAAIAASIAVSIASATTPATAQENPAIAEVRAAGKHQLDCYGAGEDAACIAMIGAYERAMSHPQATENIRHEVLRHYLHAHAVYGASLRKAKRLPDAQRVLSSGYRAMEQHFAGGAHFHTVVENQRLQLETALILDVTGRRQESDTVIGNARAALDQLYAVRDRAQGRDHAIKLLHLGLREGRVFELGLARHFAERMRDESEDAIRSDLLRRSTEAYARAELWLEREARTGAGSGWSVSQAEIRYELGMVQWDADRPNEASRAFAQATAAACTVDEARDRERLASEIANALPGPKSANLCEKAAYAWRLTNGDAKQAIGAAVDRLYEQMRKDLQAPIPPDLPALP